MKRLPETYVVVAIDCLKQIFSRVYRNMVRTKSIIKLLVLTYVSFSYEKSANRCYIRYLKKKDALLLGIKINRKHKKKH